MRILGSLLALFLLLQVQPLQVFASTGPFNPQDLSPDFFAESKATFANPHTNADCLAAENPAYCCTGAGTGTCNEPVESFRVVNCTTRNIDCTGAATPDACCTGVGTGDCCYEELDTANNFRGSTYCPASVCPDGCVNQWIEQSGHKSQNLGHPITGRTMEQDDLEKPCYESQCINGHACLVGHPKWTEPDYTVAAQPTQDATLEIEPNDRTGDLLQCAGTFYLAQLVKLVPQPQDHRLLAGFTKFKVHENELVFNPFDGVFVLSPPGVLPTFEVWYWIEIARNANNTLTLWVDGVNKTQLPVQTSTTLKPWATQSFCSEKSCDVLDNHEFRGKAAMLFYKCGTLPSAGERASFYEYVVENYTKWIFSDGFESGGTSTWTQTSPGN